jgi:hypothetical protein
MASALDAALDALYLVTPEHFIETRKALAAQLGKGQEAKVLLAQKKPTQVAHLLNRLARDHAALVASLGTIAEQLSAAHHAGKPEALREAIALQRQAVNALSAKAHTLLDELGLSPSELTGVNALLFAATASPERAAELKLGRLSKLPETTDFFGAGALVTSPPVQQAPGVPAPAAEAGLAELEAEKQRALAQERARTAAESAEQGARLAREIAEALEREVRVLEEADQVAAAAALAAKVTLRRAAEKLELARAEASQRAKEVGALRAEFEKVRA